MIDLLLGLHKINGNFRELYYQHDGSLYHTTAVCQLLNAQFNSSIINRWGQVNWPLYSPDLTATDFYFWGIIKDTAYAKQPAGVEQLQQFTEDTFWRDWSNTLQHLHTTESILRRYRDCNHVDVWQFKLLYQILLLILLLLANTPLFNNLWLFIYSYFVFMKLFLQ